MVGQRGVRRRKYRGNGAPSPEDEPACPRPRSPSGPPGSRLVVFWALSTLRQEHPPPLYPSSSSDLRAFHEPWVTTSGWPQISLR